MGNIIEDLKKSKPEFRSEFDTYIQNVLSQKFIIRHVLKFAISETSLLVKGLLSFQQNERKPMSS